MQLPKQTLCVDIGNSSISTGVFQEGMLVDTQRYPSNYEGLKTLQSAIATPRPPLHVAIASVKPPLNPPLAETLRQAKIPHKFFDATSPLSLSLDVTAPSEVGADRIANMYGALELYGDTHSIIIDIGTAMTFDVLSHERRFLGGIIAPGPQISARALALETHALPLVSISRPERCTAKDTEGNIRGGLYFSLTGSIREIVHHLKRENFLKESCRVILTGGLCEVLGSRFLDDLKGSVDVMEAKLTLYGIFAMSQEHLAKAKNIGVCV